MLPELRVPEFARIDEYAGLWAMESTHFDQLWAMLRHMNWAAHMSAPPEPRADVQTIGGAKGGKAIAFIPMLGLLMKQRSSVGGTSTIQLRRDIRQAAADPNVGAIVLGIESPGGIVAGTDDLANDVRAANRQKPVVAHVDDLCCSAAYWVASQASAIYANSPLAIIGSIGTMLPVEDSSAAAEQAGVKVHVFKTGALKGAGIPGTAITEEHQAEYQKRVDGTQAHFDAAVRKGRGLSARELEAVRTGGTWDASEAVQLKLIDGIQPLSKTLDQLATRAASPGPRADSDPGPVVLNFPMLRRVLPMRNIGE
jgi:signal peptide peptidase SppA